MKNVLVIGATGFIGGHIALAAIEQGWRVRGLRRVPGKTGHITQTEVNWYEGDIDHPDSLAQAFEGAIRSPYALHQPVGDGALLRQRKYDRIDAELELSGIVGFEGAPPRVPVAPGATQVLVADQRHDPT